MSKTEIRIVVPGCPIGKARPRVTYHGTYTPKKTKMYEEQIRGCWATQSKKRIPDGVPIEMTVKCYFPIPKSVSKKKRAEMIGSHHMKKPDLDNCIKSAMDGCQGCAFPEDARVYRIYAEKLYDENPRMEIVITGG